MVIRNSTDIEGFLTDFNRFANYDSDNGKHYFVFHDKERGGKLTLMLTNGEWSTHGIGEDYCDLEETPVSEDECHKLIWLHRKAINKSIKETLITS